MTIQEYIMYQVDVVHLAIVMCMWVRLNRRCHGSIGGVVTSLVQDWTSFSINRDEGEVIVN